MYTRLLLCQKEEGTFIIAKSPAFSSQVDVGTEVIVQNPHDRNFTHRCKVKNIMDCQIDSEEYQFVLAAHSLTPDDIYNAIYSVHYLEVPIGSNLPD